MTTTADDISIVLSGGSANINPNNSLGGDPSSAPIVSASLNNLFDDVSAEESEEGHEDYRCIYIFNDGDTPIYSVKVYIDSDEEDGAAMEVGVESRNEVQRITISGGVSGGSLTLQYNGVQFTTEYNSDLSEWAAALQETLQELEIDEEIVFKQVAVTAQNGSNGTVIFDIKWTGSDGYRNFDKFEAVVDDEENDIGNQLEPEGDISVGISVTSEGAPVNTIASEITLDTTPPGGVTFSAATIDSPLTIPRLDPEEGFPLWIKRTVAVGTEAKETDGCTLAISAQSLES